MRIDTTDVVHRDDIRSCIEQTQPVLVNSDRHGGQGSRPKARDRDSGRVSCAAWWKRTGGANNSEVADPAGRQVGAHGQALHRHVEAEANVIRTFTRVRDAK